MYKTMSPQIFPPLPSLNFFEKVYICQDLESNLHNYLTYFIVLIDICYEYQKNILIKTFLYLEKSTASNKILIVNYNYL